MCTGRLDVQLQEGRASGRAAVLPGPLPAGAVRLADVGYWSLGAFAALAPHEVFWWSRLQMQTAVDNATGDRRALLALVETQPTDTIELAVTLGERQRLAARLLAGRVPQDVADARRRRWRQAARDKGRQVSATRLALAAWTIFVTHVPTERLTLQEALVLGRMRWQIDMRQPYLRMVVDDPNPHDAPVELEIYVPHHYVKLIAAGTDRRQMRFLQ